MRNITIRNITGRAGGMGRLTGNPGDVLENIRFENSTLTTRLTAFGRGDGIDLKLENVSVNGAPWSGAASQ